MPDADKPMPPAYNKNADELAARIVNAQRLGFVQQAKVVMDGVKKGRRYDGCSAVLNFDFGYDCCGEHDSLYQDGTVSRAEADKRLRQCIWDKGYPLLAVTYWLGVRTFGGSFWKSKRDLEKSESTMGELK